MKHIKSYGMVVLGSCLTAAAFAFVVLPQGFAAGGATGLAVLLHAVIPLPVSALVLIINGLLFALG